jgi:hypothetical protein
VSPLLVPVVAVFIMILILKPPLEYCNTFRSHFSLFRYSRGGKEKKAAKRNTSESSRCYPSVKPTPSFSSHICRDVSDFDPRKNRQPAPSLARKMGGISKGRGGGRGGRGGRR